MFTGGIPQHPVDDISEVDFYDLGLCDEILDTIEEIGFEHPTPIQARVIPVALDNRDIVGLAQTGSGKTAAFVLPLAERLYHGRGLRALIVCPTREIALQTRAFVHIFRKDHDLRSACLIGGVPFGSQLDDLAADPDVVVATPGRLLDHLERGNVRLDRVEHLVLDEADHMLDLGFMPQIRRILEALPEDRQTMLFSATMPQQVERLAVRFLHDPVRIDIIPAGKTAEGISHRLYLVEPEDMKACIMALLHQELGSTLVFIRRKIDAEWLCRVLGKEGHPVERIHSDLSQSQRVRALEKFRAGQHRILVATDVAARGIDIPSIEHVVNYGMPEAVEDYIHRSGRTARGSALGLASTVASWKDKIMVREIEAAIKQELPRCTLPGVKSYEEAKPRRKTVRRRRLL